MSTTETNALATAATKLPSLEELLTQRVKSELGAIFPEDMLKKIVTQKLQDTLVEKRPRTDYHGRVVPGSEKPGLELMIEEAISEVLRPKLKQEIDRVLNSPEWNTWTGNAIGSQIEKCVKEAMPAVLEAMTRAAFVKTVEELRNGTYRM